MVKLVYQRGTPVPGNIHEGVIHMIRVIMGKKGTGKTKQMIDMIKEAVQSEHGNVV